jgi:CRISPR-associated exonuclease Cas4
MSSWQTLLLLALLVLLALIYGLWRWARATREGTGLPQGEVIYADTGAWERSAPLRAPRYGLVGKPDYLLRVNRTTIPIEVKPSRRANQPYEADLLQLAAYCLLVEETTGQRPPYGLLRYQERTFRIPYDEALCQNLLAVLQDMRADLGSREVPRSHDDPHRCRSCGHRQHCDHSLATV